MKLLSLLLLLSAFTPGFAQENPWENPKTENPWKTSETTTTESDTLKGATESANNGTSDDSFDSLSREERSEIIQEIQSEAGKNYTGKSDFAVGFGCGLILNFTGTIPATVVAIIPNKKMNEAVEKTVRDTTVAPEAPEEVREKRATIGVQNKRLLRSLGGVAVGALAQFAILIGISLA